MLWGGGEGNEKNHNGSSPMVLNPGKKKANMKVQKNGTKCKICFTHKWSYFRKKKWGQISFLREKGTLVGLDI